MTERERILDKVRKLLSLSKRNPSAAEAEAAALKAADFIERHKIAQAELGEPETQEAKGYSEVFKIAVRSRTVLIAFSELAELFDCVGLVTRSPWKAGAFGLDIAGTEADRAVALGVIRMVSTAVTCDLRRLFPGFPARQRNSFAFSMVRTVTERLKAQRDFLRSHSSKALVRVAALESVESFLRDDGVSKTKVKAAPLCPVAAAIGHIRGGALELNRPLQEVRQ